MLELEFSLRLQNHLVIIWRAPFDRTRTWAKDFYQSLTTLLILTEFTKELSICLWFSFNSSSFGEDTWSRLDCMSSWSRLGLFSTTNLHITRTWIDTSKSRQFSQWATVTGHLIWSNKWLPIFNKDPLLFTFGCQEFSILLGQIIASEISEKLSVRKIENSPKYSCWPFPELNELQFSSRVIE